MATPENLHANIPDNQLHNPKGYAGASNDTKLTKDPNGDLSWAAQYWQDPVLDLADLTLTPPSENGGDRYLLVDLTGSVVHADWDGAAENDIVTYNLAGSVWNAITPSKGFTVKDKDSETEYYFDGTTWGQSAGTAANTLQEVITAGGTYSGAQTVSITSVSGSDSSALSMAPTLTTLSLTNGTNTMTHVNQDNVWEMNVDNGSGVGSEFRGDLTQAYFYYDSGATKQEVLMNGTDITITDTTNTKGAIYAADYSSNFVNESLITKRYADAKIASQAVDALVAAPTATEDGYVIAWNDTNSEYELVAAGGGGSSLWTDNTDRVTLDTSLADMVEINDSSANTFSGTYTIGNLVVGNANTLGTFNVERVIVAGGSNTIAADSNVSSGLVVGTSNQLRDANNNVLFGNTNRAYDGSNNFASGNGNYVVGNRNIALGNGNFSALAGGPTTTDDTVLIGSSNKAGGDDQILIGRNINCTFSGWSHEMIGFGLGANRVTAGFTLPNIASGRVNFCVGGYEGMRSTNGVAKTGAGEGLYYVSNYANTDIVEPSATIADATAFYAKDRTAGKSGFKMRVEDGTNHFFGDFSAIGGDETVATANKTLTIAGTSTGSGTSSLVTEDSAGTITLEVRDDGVVIMAGLPTSSAGLPTGALWNNSGVINIA